MLTITNRNCSNVQVLFTSLAGDILGDGDEIFYDYQVLACILPFTNTNLMPLLVV